MAGAACGKLLDSLCRIPMRPRATPMGPLSASHLPPPAVNPERFPCSVKHSLADSNIAAKISADDASKVEEEVEAALRWVQTNQVRGCYVRLLGAACAWLAYMFCLWVSWQPPLPPALPSQLAPVRPAC